MIRLSMYKTHPRVTLPKFATTQSACFDLSYQPWGKTDYNGYNKHNTSFVRYIMEDGRIVVMPGDRILVPTGLIFDIPEGYSVRIHARSGLSLKQGLALANSEAVIDSDYIQETFVMITNISDNPMFINNGDRIAQAELVKKEDYVLWETTEAPQQKTDRVGGLGSTGIGIVYQPNGMVGLEVISEQPAPTISEQPVKRGRGRPRKVA